MNFSKIFKHPKGFTLIELLVVIMIISILSLIGINAYTSYSNSQTLNQAALDFANTLNTAKSKALSQVNACSSGPLLGYSVTTTASSYILNVICASGNTALTTTNLTNVSIDASSTTNNVIFKLLSGGVSGNGNVIFKLGTLSKTVSVDSAGVIQIQ